LILHFCAYADWLLILLRCQPLMSFFIFISYIIIDYWSRRDSCARHYATPLLSVTVIISPPLMSLPPLRRHYAAFHAIIDCLFFIMPLRHYSFRQICCRRLFSWCHAICQ
jgi:hypothetical protein